MGVETSCSRIAQRAPALLTLRANCHLRAAALRPRSATIKNVETTIKNVAETGTAFDSDFTGRTLEMGSSFRYGGMLSRKRESAFDQISSYCCFFCLHYII